MINGGLVAVRRRLRVDLGVGELVHRVLDRSRGRRRALGAFSLDLLLDLAPFGVLEHLGD